MEKFSDSFKHALNDKIYEIRGLLKLFYTRPHRIFLISEEETEKLVREIFFVEGRDLIIYSKEIENFAQSQEGAQAVGTMLYYMEQLARKDRLAVLLTHRNSEIWSLWHILRSKDYEENEDFIFGWRLLTEEEGNKKIDIKYLIRNL